MIDSSRRLDSVRPANYHRRRSIRPFIRTSWVLFVICMLRTVSAEDFDLKTRVSAQTQVAVEMRANTTFSAPEKERFIITARALETEQGEQETEGSESTEYSTETDEPEAEEEIRAPVTTSTGPPVSESSSGIENPSTSIEDLTVSSSNLQVQSDNRSRSDHQVLYARLKHPPKSPTEHVTEPVGFLFGQPIGRPLSPRLPTTTSPSLTNALLSQFGASAIDPEKGLIPIPLRPPSNAPTTAPESFNSATSWIKPNRWDKEKASNQRINMTRVQNIEAECQNDFMKIRLRFNGSFSGLIYSTGFAYDPLCVYINGTGRDYYEFYIQLNRCGTLGGNTHNLDSRKQPTKNFMWNTLSIQYSPLIEEEWDEHYKVTCEYGYDYWKTVTFPFLDVEVATGNPLTFTLTPPECHMEIRQGYGSTGTRVTGPVRVGDPLTLIVYMRSQYDGFDLIVSDCYAHNGASKRIQLIDNNGCPVNEKLISRFRGTWTDAGLYETQVFAYMKAFRFTASPALYIECDVRMCHGHCPNQPCYWRTAKQLNKRAAPSEKTNASLSENINLFQALQVVADDELEPSQSVQRPDTSNQLHPVVTDDICWKPSVFGAAVVLAVLLYVVLGLISCIACIRLRRSQSCQTSSPDFYPQPFMPPNSAFSKRQF